MTNLQETPTTPQQVFDPWGGVPVQNWEQLNSRIDQILRRHGDSPLVWRGVTDARWGLYSSLYRRLRLTKSNVVEQDLMIEELKILTRARREWRLDSMSALEIFAHVQHYGGPTRMLDVTANPLIASWFAVEQQWLPTGVAAAEEDCRVFCFYVGEFIELDDLWSARMPPWMDWQDNQVRRLNNWGTGSVRRVWRPPGYNARITAQNAGFLLDGVPFSYEGANQFAKGPGGGADRWSIAELKEASSIPIKLNQASRKRQTENSTPAFTFTIAAAAREQIRNRLELNYGYSTASMYADLFGLAQNASPHLPQ